MNNPLLKKHILIIFICLGLFSYNCPVFSSETDLLPISKLDWIIKNIKEKEKNLKTFIAKMVQTKNTRLLQDPLRSEGLIYFHYTGKMLLKITSPSPSIVLIKNNMLLVYYPDLSRAEKRYLGNNILKKHLGLGHSIDELHKKYSIGLVSETPSDGYHLKMIPKLKSVAKHIDSIEVTVNPENWLPQQLYLREREGDSTIIRLEFISVNEQLPAGIFSVDLPEDREDGF